MSENLFYLVNLQDSKVSITIPSLVLEAGQVSYEAFGETEIRRSREVGVLVSKGLVKLLTLEEHDELFPLKESLSAPKKVVDINNYRKGVSVDSKGVVRSEAEGVETKVENGIKTTKVVRPKTPRTITEVAADVAEEERGDVHKKLVKNVREKTEKLSEEFEKMIPKESSSSFNTIQGPGKLDVSERQKLFSNMKKSELCQRLLKFSFEKKKEFLRETRDLSIVNELKMKDPDTNIKKLCDIRYSQISRAEANSRTSDTSLVETPKEVSHPNSNSPSLQGYGSTSLEEIRQKRQELKQSEITEKSVMDPTDEEIEKFFKSKPST